MKKQYTVENVSKMINKTIRNYRMFTIKLKDQRMTFSWLLFETILKLISYEKGYDNILSRLEEDGLLASADSFVGHPVVLSINEISKYHFEKDVHKEYISLVKKLYQVDNNILIGCIPNIESYRSLANYSDEARTIPDEIANVIVYLLKKNNCGNIYYPFADDTNICDVFDYQTTITFLEENVGQKDKREREKLLEDYKKRNQLIVELCKYVPEKGLYYNRIDYLSSFGFAESNLFEHSNIYDATIGVFKDYVEQQRSNWGVNDFIDSCLNKAIAKKLAILVIPTDWLIMRPIVDEYNAEETLSNVFSKLYKGRYLRTIIELPKNCIGGDGTSFSIIVLNRDGNESKIRFVNASESVIRDTKGVCIDLSSIILSLETEKDETSIMKTYHYWDKDYYSSMLLPSVWAPICSNNQSRHLLSDLIDIYHKESFDIVKEDSPNYLHVNPEEILSLYDTHEGYYDIIVDPQKESHSREYSKYEDALKNGNTYSVEKLERGSIIVEPNLDRSLRFFNKKETCYISTGVAFHANKELVTPEYLIYVLRDMYLPFPVNLPGATDINDRYNWFFSIPVVILDSISTQISLTNTILKREFDDRLKALSADQDRFSIRTAAADIQHMLGTPFNQQIVCIENLKRNNSVNDKYVKKLIDISEYIQRLVISIGADISKADFEFKKVNLAETLSQYVESYSNYSRKSFSVSFVNKLTDNNADAVIDLDKLHLQLDTIMDNAYYHGFAKKSAANNKVEVALECVQYKTLPYYRISVMNNGQPKNPNYTIEDFISRGNYDGFTGHTGLGGNHIYHIAKKHNGYVGISSSKEWGFIVNILIPIPSDSDNYNNKYITDEQEYI